MQSEITSIDLKLVGGNFLYAELPADKEYLHKYFHGEIETRFIVYYLTFRSDVSLRQLARNFSDHTGWKCSPQWVHQLLSKLDVLETAATEARRNMDLEKLADIKLGSYKWK